MESIRHNAGIVYHILNEKGIMLVQDLNLYTHITEKELYMAVGWLACERKIHLLTDDDDWRVVLLKRLDSNK